MFKAHTHCRRCRQELQTSSARWTGICDGCVTISKLAADALAAMVSPPDARHDETEAAPGA